MKKILCALMALIFIASAPSVYAAGTAAIVNGKVATEGVREYAIWDVEVYGNYVYGADAALGLRVFEIGADGQLRDVTPDDAAYQGAMNADARNQLSIADGLLYAAFSGTAGEYPQGIRVYDLTATPAAPQCIHSNNWKGTVKSILADGSLVFAGTTGGFRIYNQQLTSSANSTVDFGGRAGQPALGRNSEWAVWGDYVFYSHRPDASDGFDDYARVDIYDISRLRETAAQEPSYVDAKDARYITTLLGKTEYLGQGQIYSMEINGNYLYIGGQTGIEVYDVSGLPEGSVEFVQGYSKADLQTGGSNDIISILIRDGYLFINFIAANHTVFARLDTDCSIIPVAEVNISGGEANQGACFVDGVFYAGARKDAVHSMKDITGVGFRKDLYDGIFTDSDFAIHGAAAGVDAVQVTVGNQAPVTVDVDENGCWSLPMQDQENGVYTVSAAGLRDGTAVEAAKDAATYRVGAVWVDFDAKSENFLQNGADVQVTVHKDIAYRGNYKAIAAGYDKAGRLMGAVESPLYSTDAFNQADTQEIDLELRAEGIETVKAFVWAEDMTPLAAAEESDEFVVAFVGDSITHRQNYTRAIETFYMTRYPNRTISFVNKGINGDNFGGANNRFDWDILNREWDALNGEYWSDNQKPDAMTVMLGMNDLGAWESWTDPDPSSPDNKEFRLNSYLQNAETFIQKVLAEGIELTIITPQPVDDYAVLEEDGQGNAVDIDVKAGRNQGLQQASDGLKQLGEEYGIPVIDMYEETVRFIETVREANPTLESVLADRNDIVHPTYNGGFVMGCIFAKDANDAQSVQYVSNVVIDAAQNSLEQTYNASVTGLDAAKGAVSYQYLAKAIPMPVSDSYQHAEQVFGLPVTETINNETIQVKGLQAGTYSLTMDGTLLGTYTADEFAAGVNIAALSANPGQIQAQKAYALLNEKAERELRYRYIAEMDSKYVRDPNAWGGIPMEDRITSDRQGFDAFYEQVREYYVQHYDTNDDGVLDETDTIWGDYRWDMRYPHFYFGKAEYTNDPDYYQYACKLDHAQTWTEMEALKAEARSILTPQQHTISITAAR